MIEVGKIIKRLSTKISRGITNCPTIKAIDECSGVNGFILKFIYKSNGVYQKDLESEFGITRSTASKIVTLMEKKNLVIRLNDSNDKRAKKLVLTPKGEEMIRNVDIEIKNFEQSLLIGLSENEIETLVLLLNKVENNIENKEVQNDKNIN